MLLLYVPWIAMFLGFINTKISTNVSYSPYSKKPSSTILPTSPNFEKNERSPIFWRMNRTPIPISFVM